MSWLDYADPGTTWETSAFKDLHTEKKGFENVT